MGTVQSVYVSPARRVPQVSDPTETVNPALGRRALYDDGGTRDKTRGALDRQSITALRHRVLDSPRALIGWLDWRR